MKRLCHLTFTTLLLVCGYCAGAQHEAILRAPPEDRMRMFWRYCLLELISDQDSLTTHRFLNNVIQGADSLGDRQLNAYAQYFQKCWRILFSERYESHFPGGYTQAVDLLQKTQTWAQENKHPDIAASCENFIGQVFYRANRYGQGFEHFLKADEAFEKIGYRHVPNASDYLYILGLCFYRFEEFDKALQKFLQAANYDFYIPRTEINTLNAIGLIYARGKEPENSIAFFRNTMSKAKQYKDLVWVGIAAGNLGNVWLAQGRNDSALFYHRINYSINTAATSKAPEDGAKTALSIATVMVREKKQDSALFYAGVGRQMAARYITDSTESLDFRKRLLKVLIEYKKAGGDLRDALLLTDSLFLVEQELRNRRDGKILSRAVENIEFISYNNKLALLKSQKDLAQWRSYVVIALLLISLIVAGAVFRDHWLRRKRQIQLAEKDKQILIAEKARAEDVLKHAEELLKTYVDAVKEKTTIIGHLESELNVLKSLAVNAPELQAHITINREKLLASTILTEKDWQQFRGIFEQVYPGFSYRLKTTYPELSPAEARFLYLMKLDLSSREMAAMLGISVEAIHKLRYRLRKKLNMEEAGSFKGVIQNIS